MKIAAYKNDYQGAITVPVIMHAPTLEKTAEEIALGIDPALEPLVIEQSDLPDAKYIMSWFISEGRIQVDLTKAKDILREGLRAWRLKPLQELDVAFQRALETGAETATIVAQKQFYRDVTSDPRIDAAQSTDDLNSIWFSFVNGGQ